MMVKRLVAFMLLALGFDQAWAAYAYVGSASNASNANTVTYSPTAGNYLVLFSETSSGGGNPTITVADNGTGGSGWTTKLNAVNVGVYSSVAICPTASTGDTTITVTYNGGTPGSTQISVVEYSGLSSTGWQGITTGNQQTAPGTGANVVTSNALSVSPAPAALIGWSMELGGNAGTTAGTSPLAFTRRVNVSVNMVEDVRITSTGSNSATFTNTVHGGTDNFSSYALAITESASSCTHDFWSSAGSFAVPNGSSGSYWSTSTGAFATPNCSTGTYWLQGGSTGSN
jgi:hypothetical protein